LLPFNIFLPGSVLSPKIPHLLGTQTIGFACLSLASSLIFLASCVLRAMEMGGSWFLSVQGLCLLNFFFCSFVRACVLLRKAWRRWISGIINAPPHISYAQAVSLASSEGMWRCVSSGSRWIWSAFLLIYFYSSAMVAALLHLSFGPLVRGLSFYLLQQALLQEDLAGFSDGGRYC
jgi:hypothetical protein